MKHGSGKILIVDDDARNIFALSAVLKSRQYECLKASDMQEALALLQQHPDVGIILLDMMMPEMDGYEAIPRIRQISHYKQVPIIAVTAQAMRGDKERCLEAGANGYVSKPVQIDELQELLKQLLND